MYDQTLSEGDLVLVKGCALGGTRLDFFPGNSPVGRIGKVYVLDELYCSVEFPEPLKGYIPYSDVEVHENVFLFFTKDLEKVFSI